MLPKLIAKTVSNSLTRSGASDALRDEERNAQTLALENCRRQFPGLNLATPGWQGLVYLEKLNILREGRGKRSTQPRTESSLF